MPEAEGLEAAISHPAASRATKTPMVVVRRLMAILTRSFSTQVGWTCHPAPSMSGSAPRKFQHARCETRVGRARGVCRTAAASAHARYAACVVGRYARQVTLGGTGRPAGRSVDRGGKMEESR